MRAFVLKMAGLAVGLAAGLAALVGGAFADDNATAQRWDARYGKAESFVYGSEPVDFLKEQMPNLARHKGRALCLAAGEGRNAVYLAQQGFDVVAVDISWRNAARWRSTVE